MKMFVMQRTLSFEFMSVSSWISFHLVVKILSRPNPFSSGGNMSHWLSFASLLCCCCVIKTYRWKAVHLLPSPVQPSNSWIFFSVLTLFFNKGHCDSSEFQRQQTHKLLYNLLIQNKSIQLIA